LAGTFSGVQAILDIPYIIDPCDCEKVQVCKPVRFLINGESKQNITSGTDFDLTVEDESGNDPVVSYDITTKKLIVLNGGGGSFTYDLLLNGVDTGQDILIDGTDITINLD